MHVLCFYDVVHVIFMKYFKIINTVNIKENELHPPM